MLFLMALLQAPGISGQRMEAEKKQLLPLLGSSHLVHLRVFAW